MKLTDVKDLVIIAVVGAVVYWLYKNREKFNVFSDKNAVYTTANELLAKAIGQEETIGSWLYNLTHGSDYDVHTYSPYTKADGTKGMYASVLIQRNTGKLFRVRQGTFGPTLEAI